VTERPKVLAC